MNWFAHNITNVSLSSESTDSEAVQLQFMSIYIGGTHSLGSVVTVYLCITGLLVVKSALFVSSLLVVHLYRAKIAQIDLNIRFA